MAPGRKRSPSRSALLRIVRQWEASFVGRCVGAFLGLQGIDRAMVIASQAFTALIPLLMLVSALAPVGNPDLVANTVVTKFALQGDAAAAVRELFAHSTDRATGVLSVVILFFSGLSLARRMQRMYLQAWRLSPVAGVRGGLNAALGLAALLLEVALLSLVRTLVRGIPVGDGAGVVGSALGGLVLWTTIPWLLLDRRVSWRRLLPAGLLTSLSVALYGLATTVYMPRLIETYSVRYGLFGVTLALVGWLLVVALIVVAATVVAAEFDRSTDSWARRLRGRLGLDRVSAHGPLREDHAAGRAGADAGPREQSDATPRRRECVIPGPGAALAARPGAGGIRGRGLGRGISRPSGGRCGTTGRRGTAAPAAVVLPAPAAVLAGGPRGAGEPAARRGAARPRGDSGLAGAAGGA